MDNKTTEPLTYKISSSEIKKRNINMMLGMALAFILCFLAWQAHLTNSDKYNATLLISIIAFTLLFGLFNLYGHIRYMLRIEKHHLSLEKEAIHFVQGDEKSTLNFSDVMMTERQSRIREGSSLVIRLHNKRIIRLVGYENMSQLIEGVDQRVAAVQEDKETQPS
ncbi:hypothetical protein [Magnetococcus sp. PR-3]|uniref:hypothetical protein n=1 Tax=Magnetococcus sp. PR-3 TaxID=3120355 RepID=UPI002FCDF875